MNRFTDNGDGTVTDNKTGLMWIKNANMGGQKTWQDATGWCNNLDYAGYKDWRLPNTEELISLTDRSQYDPALPGGHPFTGVQSYEYWSSTTTAGNTDYAWYVGMYDGYVYYGSNTYSNYVWAVRTINKEVNYEV